MLASIHFAAQMRDEDATFLMERQIQEIHMKPDKLTEDMPESTQDLKDRKLILDSGEPTQTSAQQLLTEDLPQEEDEGGEGKLLTEDL